MAKLSELLVAFWILSIVNTALLYSSGPTSADLSGVTAAMLFSVKSGFLIEIYLSPDLIVHFLSCITTTVLITIKETAQNAKDFKLFIENGIETIEKNMKFKHQSSI